MWALGARCVAGAGSGSRPHIPLALRPPLCCVGVAHLSVCVEAARAGTGPPEAAGAARGGGPGGSAACPPRPPFPLAECPRAALLLGGLRSGLRLMRGWERLGTETCSLHGSRGPRPVSLGKSLLTSGDETPWKTHTSGSQAPPGRTAVCPARISEHGDCPLPSASGRRRGGQRVGVQCGAPACWLRSRSGGPGPLIQV